MVESVQTFYKELSPILEKHRDSLDNLVEGTQVSKVTVWRWLNGINTKYPDPNKLLSVLKKVSGQNHIKEIACGFGGEIEKYLEYSLPILFLESFALKNDSVEISKEMSKDFYSFIILSLCGNISGVTEEELINTVGNLVVKKAEIPEDLISSDLITTHGVIAKKRIKNFIDSGIIKLEEDGKLYLKITDLRLDSTYVSKHLGEIIPSFLNNSASYLGLNAFFSYQETIPSDIANELAVDTKKFYLQCMEKMNKHRCKDGIPYQIINYGNSMRFEETEKSPSQRGGK